MSTVTNLEEIDKVQWHHACMSVAETLVANLDPIRVTRALALAQQHAVAFGSEEPNTLALVTSGKSQYSVNHDFLCACKDAEKHPGTCKHAIAVVLTQQALLLLEHQGSTPEPEEVSLEDDMSGELWEPDPEPTPPVDDLSILDVPEMPKPALPAMTYTVENPAGFNFKAKVGNMELWYTFHDTHDDALIARLVKTLPILQEMVEACEARQKGKAPAPPQAPIQGTSPIPLSTRNGTPPPESNDTDASWCPHHQMHMEWHAANERGPGWYSHRLGSGGYCRGGN